MGVKPPIVKVFERHSIISLKHNHRLTCGPAVKSFSGNVARKQRTIYARGALHVPNLELWIIYTAAHPPC